MKLRPCLRIAVVCCVLVLFAGCATTASTKTTRPQPGQHALIVFKITHQDRAGESGTVICKTGEIVTVDRDGNAVIAGDEGDIIQCPARALYAVTPQIAAALPNGKQAEVDYVAAEELERWFPAQTVPFTMQWKSRSETMDILKAMSKNRKGGG